ncbi:STAS domain-containing protein [Streptomyces sp. NPDC017448]|uniref:STAS domain-containing protein n=1 Tax=Streptomyces sp. NPDC017448 TaxID=3364996 RepID=UPI0037A994AA
MTGTFLTDLPYAQDAWAAIALSGESNVTTAPAVRARALELIAAGHPGPVADLAGVTFCDASGLGALPGVRRRAKDADGPLARAAIAERPARPLGVTGMGTCLPARASTGTVLMARQDNRFTA